MATKTAMLKLYPVYKPSGVEWFGEVPVHWKMRRLQVSVSDCVGGVWGSEPDGVDDLPCIRVADFDRKLLRVDMDSPTLRSITQNDRNRRVLSPGDLLLEKSGGGDLQPVGVVMLYDHQVPAVCSNFIARLRIAPEFDPVFLTYLHSTLYSIRLNTRAIKQTTGIQNLDISAYLGELVCFPPLCEQRAIAVFLDHETAKIDALVSKKERLIELLQEKRTALISHTVTQGLDPKAPTKDSGVEWLGDIPAHWEVRRLRNLGEAIIGLTYSPQNIVEEEDGILVLRASNIYGGQLVYPDNVYVRCSVPERLITRKGDILICSRSGSRALIGKNARIDSMSSGATFGAFMTVFRSRHNDYIYHVFNSRLFDYQSGAFNTSTINQLTLGILNDFKISWPPLSEQRAIADFLDRETPKLDNLIARVHTALKLLKELRTALISAAVTGKIDVREEKECT